MGEWHGVWLIRAECNFNATKLLVIDIAASFGQPLLKFDPIAHTVRYVHVVLPPYMHMQCHMQAAAALVKFRAGGQCNVV
jgi:hypothetical protein